MTAINWSNVTSLASVPNAANTATDGGFWVAILYMFWIILLLLIIDWGWEAALLVSSFLAFIISLLLTYADLVAWTWCLPFIGIMLFMFLYITYVQQQSR